MELRRWCAGYRKRLPIAALASAVLATAPAGCGDAGGSGQDDARARGADHVPTLPGAGPVHNDAAEPPKPALAQHFGSNDGAMAGPASGALLPPVMHSAD